MEFEGVLKARRSVRKFKDEEIPNKKIRKVLELANSAPSAGNLQAFRVVVVKDKNIREGLSGAALGQISVADAPVNLVICAVPEESAVKYGDRGRELYSIQDATIFAAYIQLAIASLGLSSVWVGAFNEEEVAGVLELEENIKPVAIVPIGYPAEEPGKTRRKSLNEIIYKEL